MLILLVFKLYVFILYNTDYQLFRFITFNLKLKILYLCKQIERWVILNYYVRQLFRTLRLFRSQILNGLFTKRAN